MEFHDVIEKRRSIRKFLNKPVEDKQLEQLINSARLCQSAKNRQPWKFMILKGEQKDWVAQNMLDLFERNNVDLPGAINSAKFSAQIIKEAAAIILVFGEGDKDWLMPDLLSIGAAIEHICLEAVNLGLGSLWIADVLYTACEIVEYVGCTGLQLVSGVAIGYPGESPNPRPRKALDEVLIKK